VSTIPKILSAQTFTATGKASAEALISNSTRQPFYFWTNQLGQVSALEQVNFFTHLSASAVYTLQNPSQSFFAGGNVNYKQTKSASFNVPEMYGGFSAKYFQITGGLFADSLRMYGLSPSNSNFMTGQNTAPQPRVRLGSNGFIKLGRKNIYVAGLYEEGVLKDPRAVTDARLHHKNLYISMGNAKKLQLTAGLDHFVFWGGYTDEEDYSVGFADYLKVVFAGKYYVEEYGYMNTVGNQLGQYQFILRKSFKNIDGTFQISHPFEDLSGVRLQNYPDNIFTLLLQFQKDRFIEKLLMEYTYTKHQSGDPANPENGGTGGDSYLAHSQYRSGFTFKGNIIGNPLFGPVSFTEEGIPSGPQNNRFSAFHTGISGELFPALQYKLMVTYSENFGRYSAPFENVREQFFSQLSFRYLFPNKQNLFIETNFAFDNGSLWSGSSANVAGLGINVGIVF
jgi:hypothetical protein